MSDSDQTEAFAARRGQFDDQLELGGSLLDQVQLRLRVVKRDGQLELFDSRKISRAIACAAADGPLADYDTARGLATGVTLYLGHTTDGDALPTDAIHAAVERLLIEMGHPTVAAAFSRQRDRKRRLADLARGEMRRLGAEPGPPLSAASNVDIEVLNSDDTVSEWNRDRIVKALHQETELDRATANRVAEVVESELAKLNLKTVTSGLVRELVGAVLLSLGETDQGARHRRVGIPMYDAERTILGAEAAELGRRATPDSTNEALAGRLKREFALARVFSQDVAEAHRWGDIHLHGLDAIDRVLSMVVTPDWVKLHGVPGGPSPRVSPVRARRADTLIAQMAGASATLRHYVTERLRWDAVNWGLAPFVDHFDANELKDLSRVLLFEFAYRRMTDPGMMPLAIDLMWSVPPQLQGATPIGPRDQDTHAAYDAYAAPARRLALAILDVHREASSENAGLQLPEIHVSIGPDCFLDRGFSPFLMRVSELASVHSLTIAFQRDALLIGPSSHLVAPREIVAHRVTLNLPRAAYRSRDAAEFLRECERVFDMAVAAHTQKRAFLMRLARIGDDGPLAAIARRFEGAPWFAPERAVYEIGLAGTAEAFARFCGSPGLESDLIARLAEVRDQWSETEEMELRIAPTQSERARERLAEADLRYYYLHAAEALRPAIERGRVRYSNPAEHNALDRIAPKAGQRATNDATVAGAVRMPDLIKEASPETIAHTIRDCFTHSAMPSIRF